MTPTGWQITLLGDLGPFSKGRGITKGEVADVGLPCVRYGQIYTEHHDWIRKFSTHVSPAVAQDSRRLLKGELLFAGSGETAEEIGKCVAFVGEEEAYVGGDIVILTPKDVDAKFMGYALNAPDVVKQKMRLAQGDAVVHISASALASISVMLPPRREQQAIAEALTDADAAVESIDSLIAKKRDVKLAAAQGLTSGRVRLAGFDGSWESVQVAQVATVNPEALGAGTPDDFGFRYISLENVDGGLLLGWSDERFASAPSRARRVLQRGDFLFATVRPNLMGHLFFDLDEHDWICSTGFAVIRAKPAVCKPNYLSQVMLSHQVSEQVGMLISGSNYPAVSAKEVGSLTIPLPPIEEQDAIGNVLSDMDTEIDTLLAKRDKLELVKQGMMQELLSGRVRLV